MVRFRLLNGDEEEASASVSSISVPRGMAQRALLLNASGTDAWKIEQAARPFGDELCCRLPSAARQEHCWSRRLYPPAGSTSRSQPQ